MTDITDILGRNVLLGLWEGEKAIGRRISGIDFWH